MKTISAKAKNILTYTFLGLEAFLYVVILFWHIIPINIACYLSIIFVFLYSLIFWSKDINTKLIQIGLFFTLVADFFLVLLNGMSKEVAMLAFSIVQIVYFVYLIRLSSTKRERLANIIVRSALIFVVELIAIIVLKSNLDVLVIVSIFYFCNLATNIVFAFVHCKSILLFALGLLLFAFCDLIIGLQFVCIYLDIATTSLLYKLVYSSFNFTWLFYLPSQVLIVFSIYWKNKKLNLQKQQNETAVEQSPEKTSANSSEKMSQKNAEKPTSKIK